MDPLKIYDYLLKTRERIFDAVRPLSREDYHREFPIGLKTIAATLAHLMISEWYYIERLTGRDVPPYEQWPIKYESPPERFETIEKTWREQAKNVRSVIEAGGATLRVANHDAERRATSGATNPWSRTTTWLSFPDDTGGAGGQRYHITCTAGDLFAQLALHEVHHRAQIMAMLRQLGAAIVEDIDYNALMFERVEASA